MREGLLDEIKEALLDEMGVDVNNFKFIGEKGLQVAVSADGHIFVLEFDQYWEEATIVSTTKTRKLWEAV